MNPDIAGKYIHEANGSHYLELKPDGSCFLFEGSSSISGTYEIDGSLITITNAGSYTKGMIQDGVITDAEGDRWIRAKAAGQATASPTNLRTATSSRHTESPKRVTFDEMIDSIPWLSGLIAKNLPWELFEAIGWVVVLMLVIINVLNARS